MGGRRGGRGGRRENGKDREGKDMYEEVREENEKRWQGNIPGKLQIKGKICERWKTEKLEKTCPVIPQGPTDRDTPFREYNS